MKKIKRLLALVAMTCALTSAFAESADIVVLMDASGTILPWFDQINNRILVDITRKFVREGDTFHLVSFNSRVNLEIVQPIETEADISRVVSRFMLLYPLGQNSDFLSGLQYTWQYVSSLDHLRDKIIIVISDGIFNPPLNSPYAQFTPEQVKSELSALSRKIRSAGWNVYYIKLPFPEQAEIRTLDGNLLAEPSSLATADASGAAAAAGTAGAGANGAAGTARTQESPAKAARRGKNAAPLSAGETSAPAAGQKTAEGVTRYYDVSSDFTDALDIPQSPLPEADVPITFIDSVLSMPEIEFPEDIGRKGRAFILPFKVHNVSDNPVNMELTGVYLDGSDILGKNSFLNLSPGSRGTLRAEIHLPPAVKKGPADLPLSLEFSGNLRVHPQSGTVHLTVMNFSPEIFFRAGGPVVFALILITIAALLVVALFVFIFRRTSTPAADAVRSAASREDAAREAEIAAARNRPAAPAAAARSMPARAFPSASEAIAKAAPAGKAHTAESAATLAEAAASAAPASAASILGRATAFGKKIAKGVGGVSAGSSSGAEILEAAKANNASDAAQILANARSAEAVPREIAWTPEKRELPVAAAPSFDPDARKSVDALASIIAAEKDERAAILDAAARKKKPQPQLRSGASPSDHIAVRENRNTMLELYVRNQNPNIGKRNIHMMKAGTRLGLGGGSSAFLVFLVKFPPNVAEIRYDGQNCSLAILKPQYFPYERSNIIENCIGREITMVSDKQYEVTFEIRVYEDPVLKLNRILTSISY